MTDRAKTIEDLFIQMSPVLPAGALCIDGSGIVVAKSARNALFRALRGQGYNIEKSVVSSPKEKRKGRWYVRLRDDVLVRKGKCGFCGKLVDSYGMCVHNRICEHCGKVIYREYTDGGWIGFSFAAEGMAGKRITMRTKRFEIDDDRQAGDLILYADPIEPNELNTGSKLWASAAEAREVLARHEESFDRFTEDGIELIGVRKHRCRVDVLETWSGTPHEKNVKAVKVYEGVEYDEHAKVPVLNGFIVQEE